MKTLILTENPSVAGNIGEALSHVQKKEGFIENEAYVITWAHGHLYTLKNLSDYDLSKKSWNMGSFPFIPKVFEYKPIQGEGSSTQHISDQIKVFQNLVNRSDIDTIISACENDREGQMIGDVIFKMVKPKQKILRLLLNEWTQSAILKGLRHLKSNEQMQTLRDAAISRQWADWVISSNLTAVTTLKYSKDSDKILNIGRILLATLKIIYDRELFIENFIRETRYKLKGIFLASSDAFEGVYLQENEDCFKSDEILKSILEDLQWPEQSLEAIVHDKETKVKKIFPPALFNLTALQGHICSQNKGWTAQKVLETARSLYEKKYITYPATASIALDENIIEETKKVLEVHGKDMPYASELKFKVTKRIFDQSKVSRHSAIIPTYLLANNLSSDEMTVYFAIKNRFLKQFLPEAVYEETFLLIDIKGYLFKTSGKICLQKGWELLDSKKQKISLIPSVSQGDTLQLRALNIVHDETHAPELHDEKTLLQMMETCGRNKSIEENPELLSDILKGFTIGTAATRGKTIKKLFASGYVEKHQAYLKCTPLGRRLIKIFPVKKMFDLNFTADIEKKLEDVERGLLSRSDFLNEIFKFAYDSSMLIKVADDALKVPIKETIEIIGVCPSCGGQVVENSKSYTCNQWKKGCKFVIWKEDLFFKKLRKKPSKTMVKALLKDKKVKVTGFTSKTGHKFDAYVYYEKKSESQYYQWRLEF
jgi:DNA topoisomerase-3